METPPPVPPTPDPPDDSLPDDSPPEDGPPDWRRWVVPVGLGVAYGVFFRFVVGLDIGGDWFPAMSLAFISGVPLVMGAITVLRADGEVSWGAALLTPWVPVSVMLVAALFLAWEGLICVVVWLPMALLAASAGGLVGKVARLVTRRRLPVALGLAALPVVFAPVESRGEDPLATRTVHDAVVIEADAGAVWREIREVRPITEAELGDAFAYRIGFPRPVAATLVGEGVGAVREATFEGGVTFVERVTEWEENERLAFTIDASAVPSTTFDQHVAVGGRYFDVLWGRYEIEPLGPGRVALHLTSEQRLSTRFNGYTQLWTDRFMSDIQATILDVVKARAEAR